VLSLPRLRWEGARGRAAARHPGGGAEENKDGTAPIVPGKPEAKKIAPSPEAPKAKRRRRLALDLTGLPPSPEEVAAFTADAEKFLKVGLAPEPTGDKAELAAWTSLCRVLLNAQETITRY